MTEPLKFPLLTQPIRSKTRLSQGLRDRDRTMLLLLLFWIAIGACLRFTNLAAKPPWTDEFATLVFSSGNSYGSVALNEMISLESLLQPLQNHLGGGLNEVVTRLIAQDNHPPLFFALLHLWMKLLPAGQYVSVWAARSLPALFGVLSIPAIYGLARVAFRSPAIAQWAAAMMAVSPYGVYLAQEARHYTLAILFVIGSLLCLAIAVRHLWHGTLIPIPIVVLWVLANTLGFLTHYFFVLTLGAEALALLVILFALRRDLARRATTAANLWRLAAAAAGTAIAILFWLKGVLPENYGSTMTEWIQNDNRSLLAVISPIFQLGAAIVTMFSLLPVESPSLPFAILSGALMLGFVIWAFPVLGWGLKVQWRQPSSALEVRLFVAFVGSAIALFFILTYLFGIDITRGARYSFVYFPGVILLLGAMLAACWQFGFPRLHRGVSTSFPRFIKGNGKLSAIAIWLVGLSSAITVAMNFGYQKYYRPDLLVPHLDRSSAESILIATTHQTLVQTGEMMGIAWQLKDHPMAEKTFFLLAQQSQNNDRAAVESLQQAIQQLPRPLDLWLVNFKPSVTLDDCVADTDSFPHINGYNFRLYRCPQVTDIRAREE